MKGKLQDGIPVSELYVKNAKALIGGGEDSKFPVLERKGDQPAAGGK